MKLSVFGVGYVGLVTAACFAEMGNEVLACDIDGKKIAALRAGIIPIYEPGLEEIVARAIAAGRLLFTTDPAQAVAFGEIIFVAVGTPSLADGSPDLQYIRAVTATIGDHLSVPRQVIVMKSTVPIGTSVEIRSLIEDRLRARDVTLEFAVVSNPEFLKEGDAIRDFMEPDRVVVGVAEDWAREKMAELYAPFTATGRTLLFMDPASSEMSKYASNALLAAKISFINQIAGLCEELGADVEEVRKAVTADTRIGPHFLNPGIGYGGSCFPKDVQALVALARAKNIPADLIESIEAVNERQKERIVTRAKEVLGDLSGKTIALWGLAFKPRTDDMRQAPSITIVEGLLAAGAQVRAYDPIAMTEARKIFGERIGYAQDMYECVRGADALFLVTEWAEFREPDFKKMAALMSGRHIFDGRNIYDSARVREQEFEYVGVGRRMVAPNPRIR